jgi:hypothetical protein
MTITAAALISTLASQASSSTNRPSVAVPAAPQRPSLADTATISQASQAALASASSAASGTTNASTDTVTLSDTAQEMAAQATSWASMSQSQLQGIYNGTWNTFVQFDANFATQGTKVFYADEQTTGTPAEIAFSKQVANYMVSIHEEPQGGVANPYAGASRAVVTSIMYDTSGKYTTSERYAAAAEQGQQDFIYFKTLGDAAVRNSSDQPQLYQGALDYYDALSPVEKSVVPGGYQEQTQAYLNQSETLFGMLSKKDADGVQQFMLNTFNEGTVSGTAASTENQSTAASSTANQSTIGGTLSTTA